MSDQDSFEVPNYDDPAVMAGVKNGNVAVPTQPESSMSQVEFIAGLRVIPEILENMSHGKSLRIDGERGVYGMGPIGNVGFVVNEIGVVGDITVSKLIELAMRYNMGVASAAAAPPEPPVEVPAEIPELKEFPE